MPRANRKWHLFHFHCDYVIDIIKFVCNDKKHCNLLRYDGFTLPRLSEYCEHCEVIMAKKTKGKAVKPEKGDDLFVVGNEGGKVIKATNLFHGQGEQFSAPTTEVIASLREIEDRLIILAKSEQMNWVQQYKLMAELNDNRDYYFGNDRPDLPKSFSAWLDDFCDRVLHVSNALMWRRYSAGRYYERYMKRNPKAPDLEHANLSAEKLDDLRFVYKDHESEGDKMVLRALNGNLTNRELKNMRHVAKTARMLDKEVGLKSKKSKDGPKSGAESAFTADDIKSAIAHSRFCEGMSNLPKAGGTREKVGVRIVYVAHAEFAIRTTERHAQMIDMVVIENMTANRREDVIIHGIEIKVRYSDLINDRKKNSYMEFVDKPWLAVPRDNERLVAEVRDNASAYEGWGVLVMESDRSITIMREPPATPGDRVGVMRMDTLSQALIYIGAPYGAQGANASAGHETAKQGHDQQEQGAPEHDGLHDASEVDADGVESDHST